MIRKLWGLEPKTEFPSSIWIVFKNKLIIFLLIQSDETATPPEPTDPGCLKKIGQLRSNAIFNL